MRSTTGKYITLIIGLLVAMAAVLSQTVSFHLPADNETEVAVSVSAESSDDQRQQEERFAHVSPTSLPTPPFVSFNYEAICLFEILFSEDSSSHIFETAATPLTELFSILLGAVISPNAP